MYSAAKQNPALSLCWARAPERGLPRPDAVLFLDLDEAEARARGGWGGEVYERAEMQRRVRELFLALSRGGGGGDAAGVESGLGSQARQEEDEDLVVLDAGGSVEEVAEEIWGKVKETVERVVKGELGRAVRTVQ